MPKHNIYPDVALLEHLTTSRNPFVSGTAVLERGDMPEVISVFPSEIKEGFIEVRRVRSPKQGVTLIEVLSYANKAPGSKGRKEYLDKQQQILQSDTNLLEIDLLRRGTHDCST